MAKDPYELYREAIYGALEKCQFVEENLRVCIWLASEVARVKLQDYFPVKFCREDVARLSLGRLAGIYLRLTMSAKVTDLLKTIVEGRNYVAHRSLLLTLEHRGSVELMRESIEKMNRIEQRAGELQNELLDERYALQRKLRGIRACRNKSKDEGG